MKYWVTFVGEGRSGHTVVSGILGTHPHICMGEEQKHISKWLRLGFLKEQHIKMVLGTGVGKERYKQGWSKSKICSHEDPLLIVGDKCGWDAVNEVAKRGAPTDIITRFGEHMELPVKVIHTSRFPLDNISAWIKSPKYKRQWGNDSVRFQRMIKRYRRFYQTAEKVMEGQDVFHLRNEELISNPSAVIQNLSEWLELPNNRPWRRDCAKMIFSKPNQHHNTINWPDNYRQDVRDIIEDSPSLHYYRSYYESK